MAKFIVVGAAPEKLEKGEIVIGQPDFVEQIVANQRKAPRLKQTAPNHIREILSSIAEKYDHELPIFRIPMGKYTGVAYKDDTELSQLIVNMLRTEYPAIFDKVLEYKLKNRPLNTKLVYYVGSFGSTGPFYNAGLDLLEEKDLESFLTGKPKRAGNKGTFYAKDDNSGNGGSSGEQQ